MQVEYHASVSGDREGVGVGTASSKEDRAFSLLMLLLPPTRSLSYRRAAASVLFSLLLLCFTPFSSAEHEDFISFHTLAGWLADLLVPTHTFSVLVAVATHTIFHDFGHRAHHDA